jgi:hypothetical protein
MLSSRVDDPVPGAPGRRMADLRRAIKDDLEAAQLLGWKPFEVLINEDEPPREGDRDAVQHCLDEAASADVVVALVNGNAGWSVEPRGVGICHLELKHALDVAPAKVRVIQLPRGPASSQKDRAFQEWLEGQRGWSRSVSTFDEAVAVARIAAVDALGALAAEGGRLGRRGSYDSGDALAWSRLGSEARAERMVAAARSAALDRAGSRETAGEVVVRVAGREVLLRIHAVPGPMSEPTARARVGQPFLRDHELAGSTDGLAGPVHLVACHRGVTESQAVRILGFTDATLVTPRFGVWAADPIQRAQLLFLAQCRDATATRVAVQRAFEWLEESGEGPLLVARAEARARIVAAIAREVVGADDYAQIRAAGHAARPPRGQPARGRGAAGSD